MNDNHIQFNACKLSPDMCRYFQPLLIGTLWIINNPDSVKMGDDEFFKGRLKKGDVFIRVGMAINRLHRYVYATVVPSGIQPRKNLEFLSANMGDSSMIQPDEYTKVNLILSMYRYCECPNLVNEIDRLRKHDEIAEDTPDIVQSDFYRKIYESAKRSVARYHSSYSDDYKKILSSVVDKMDDIYMSIQDSFTMHKSSNNN